MMAERGLPVSHTSPAVGHPVCAGVRKTVEPTGPKACTHPGGLTRRTSRVRGKWHYLYRAVDKRGKTVDFLLRPDRGIAAAQAFFRKALATILPRWPRKITLDGHAPSHQALPLLRREDPKWKYVLVRKLPLPEQHR